MVRVELVNFERLEDDNIKTEVFFEGQTYNLIWDEESFRSITWSRVFKNQDFISVHLLVPQTILGPNIVIGSESTDHYPTTHVVDVRRIGLNKFIKNLTIELVEIKEENNRISGDSKEDNFEELIDKYEKILHHESCTIFDEVYEYQIYCFPKQQD
jgi:DNA polymerase III epsilon subunit-like protein